LYFGQYHREKFLFILFLRVRVVLSIRAFRSRAGIGGDYNPNTAAGKLITASRPFFYCRLSVGAIINRPKMLGQLITAPTKNI